MLKKYNETILEWLVLSGHQEQALRFWKELGCPPGIDESELKVQSAFKTAVQQNQYAEAYQYFDDLAAFYNYEKDTQWDALFRIAFAEVVLKIKKHGDPVEIIEHARRTVVPILNYLEDQPRAEYSRMLNSFTALLVLPAKAAPMDTEMLKDEERLRSWVLEGAQRCFSSKYPDGPKLDTIVKCYQHIGHSLAAQR